ncbi:MAG: RagB/SusD family nutrient uptake outer membrane protein [Bacteroidia bacterium]|nr:RagB/SusD family nutrient uptake outer membrane protein [Bacteroidia bacterium]
MFTKNILKSFLLIGSAALMLVSCNKEYLDTAPESSTSPATIFESTENAELAINGICKMMSTQYLSTQGMNGEGTIKTWYANCMGNDFQRNYLTGWLTMWNWEDMEDDSTKYNYYLWYYYYKLIGNANQVICNIDNAEGSDSDKQFIKAQALVFRAYSFFMLSQFYCNRWVDSNNGASKGLVLRIDTSVEPQALATLGETYAQIYADLDEAISLFQASGRKRDAGDFFLPDLDVAYAVYARAALTREDWANAAKYAALARANYSLMSSKDYMDSGFSVPNDEWIWGVYEAEDQTIYYYGFYAYQGSDASSSMERTYPVSISKELYDQIPATDVRRKLWLEPTAEELAECNQYGKSSGALYKRAFAEFGSKIYSTSQVYIYMQFKFQGQYQPGGGPFTLFRAAEMYLTEAEADCHLGKESEAQKLLNELNKNHNASYNCTKTGADLLTEVKLYRRIDLWGEGFDWFDYKRWNQPIVRKSIADGGSFQAGLAKTFEVSKNNGWTWVIPKKEKDYNNLVK